MEGIIIAYIWVAGWYGICLYVFRVHCSSYGILCEHWSKGWLATVFYRRAFVAFMIRASFASRMNDDACASGQPISNSNRISQFLEFLGTSEAWKRSNEEPEQLLCGKTLRPYDLSCSGLQTSPLQVDWYCFIPGLPFHLQCMLTYEYFKV